MTMLHLTEHAQMRASQRAFRMHDFEMLSLIASEVEDGFLLTRSDFESLEHKCKRFIQRVRRLQGKRMVVAHNEIVTAYHATERKQRKLLRAARNKGWENNND